MIYIFNSNWVDTRWQQYSTHLHTNSTQNTQNGTYITIKKLQEFQHDENCKIANMDMYIDIIRYFTVEVGKKHPEKLRIKQLVSPPLQCSSTPVGLIKDFLAKDNVTTMDHPPYSPDLTSTVPSTEVILKGRRLPC
jgi:hypothetical protein